MFVIIELDELNILVILINIKNFLNMEVFFILLVVISLVGGNFFYFNEMGKKILTCIINS